MNLLKLAIILLFFISANSNAEPLEWYEHPGFWFKNVLYSPANGSVVPEIKAVDLTGNQKLIKDYSSHYILLSFWASWCPPCLKELPQLETLETKFKKSHFKVLALNVHDSKDDALDFIKSNNIGLTVLLDVNAETAKNYAISPLPTNYLINRKTNKLIQKWQGNIDIGEVEHFINSLIKIDH